MYPTTLPDVPNVRIYIPRVLLMPLTSLKTGNTRVLATRAKLVGSSLASENLRFASFLPDALPFEPSIGAITKGNRPSEHAVCLATVWTRDVQKERSETVVRVFRIRLLH